MFSFLVQKYQGLYISESDCISAQSSEIVQKGAQRGVEWSRKLVTPDEGGPKCFGEVFAINRR